MRSFILGLTLLLFPLLFTPACISQPTGPEFIPVVIPDPGIQEVSVMIDKSDRKLYLQFDRKKVKAYSVVFGFDPVNDKRMEGDGCTPEGGFAIRDLYDHKDWQKFIWIDYPNEASWEKHKTSKLNGDIPPEATIGGEIGIHGVPGNMDNLIPEKQDWTLGCISMRNEDVREVFSYLEKGDSVFIQP